MKLQGRIPIEPLDEERLTNIERRLVVGVSELGASQARAPRRSFGFAGAVMAVVAAGVIGWKLHRPGAPEAPGVASGSEQLAVVHTGERSTITVDDATIASDPGSAFDITHSAGRVVVQMTRGKLELAVQHHPGRVLVIRAGETEIEDIGTRFSVDYDGKDHVEVRVTEGEVKVTRHAQTTRVAAGNEWMTSNGLVAIATVAPVPATSNSAGSANAGSANAGSANAGSADTVATNDVPTLHDRHAAVPETHAHVHTTVPAIATTPTPAIDTRAHKASLPPVDPYVELRIAIRKQPIAFDPKIDGKSDAASEIARLKKIAYSPTTMGAAAAQALYQIAVLLHRPLGQDAEALSTLEMYRRRFAGGKEMSAALWLRVRIQCGHTIDEDCRKAAYSYQHQVITGEAADVAIRITNAQ